MAKILNDSLNQTLTRTLISNGTTFLAVLGLFLFGGEVLRGFGFAMVVGIIVGTYSTLFIAVPLVNWWYVRQEKSAGAGEGEGLSPAGGLTLFHAPRGNSAKALSVNRIRGRRGGNNPCGGLAVAAPPAGRVLR